MPTLDEMTSELTAELNQEKELRKQFVKDVLMLMAGPDNATSMQLSAGRITTDEAAKDALVALEKLVVSYAEFCIKSKI